MPEFSFNIVAGSRCGKTTTAHQFVFANATPERPALHFTILGASPRYQRAATGALWRRIGIITARKSPRLEGTFPRA